MTQNEPRVCEGCGQAQPERQPDSDPIPPQPEGDYFVIDLPEKLFLGSYVVQHAGGWGWQFAGGNKGGSAYTWDELAKRFKFGQPGGATITRLVRETAMPVNSNGDDDRV